MRISFEISGAKEFDRAFNRVGEHVSDLRPVWEHAEKAFYRLENEQFKSEGAKGRSGKWKELTRPYAERKAIDYPGQPILRRTGRLEKSLTGHTADSVLVKDKLEFGIGTNLFYAAFHQEGTSKMTARPPISFSDDQRTVLTKEIQKGLLKVMKADRQVTQSINVE